MQYPIDAYKQAAASAFSSLLPVFSSWTNGWQVANVFDTLTDYVVRNPRAEPSPNVVVQAALDRWKNTQGSMCWYDDYAWWGIASSKAFDNRYATVFGTYRSTFQDIAITCWKLVNGGKPSVGTYKYLGAPAVWANRDEGDQPGYFTTNGWAVPRFAGGVWQYDMWVDARSEPPDCTPNENPEQPGLKLSDPNSPYCPLGPFQNTVMNGLYLELALRLAIAYPAAGSLASARNELAFLRSWFSLGEKGLLQRFDDGSLLVRERVPTYAERNGTFPLVQGFGVESEWCGDQGLLLGGLVDKLRIYPADPKNPADQETALGLTSGVLLHMTGDRGVEPYSSGFNQTDDNDYCSGQGVFWRYFLYAFEHNVDVKAAVLKLVAGNPKTNAIYVSAENAGATVCPDTNPLFTGFNSLATLLAAITILEQAT